MEQQYILITSVGKTDPMRGGYDGPILHIVRNYKPKKVYLLLTSDIGEEEKKWGHNQKAISLLGIECEIIPCFTGIVNPHSYDELMPVCGEWCKRIYQENENSKLLVNITSGTPQLITTLAMIGMGNPGVFLPVQVSTPEKAPNKAPYFKPDEDTVEEWFENNFDNIEDEENRCTEPGLFNFRTPIIRFQIESLIQNYDYSGAISIYKQNKELFSEKLGDLLEHGRKRLNLEYDMAKKIAVSVGEEKELYPSPRKDIAELADYFNCMLVKKHRGELNDFMLRLEVLTQYLGIYILERCLKFRIDEIVDIRGKSKTQYTSKEKFEKLMPDIDEFLNREYFFEEKHLPFEWGKALNSRVIICLIMYLSRDGKNSRFKAHADEMFRWVKLSSELRNPAAHTIVAITPELISKSYDGKSVEKLCTQIESVMRTAFGTEASTDTFKIYNKLNMLCGKHFME